MLFYTSFFMTVWN